MYIPTGVSQWHTSGDIGVYVTRVLPLLPTGVQVRSVPRPEIPSTYLSEGQQETGL